MNKFFVNRRVITSMGKASNGTLGVSNYCTILFSNEQKAHAYFINGVWSKIYFKYHNLDDMRSHMQALVKRELPYVNSSLLIEGISPFSRISNNTWVSEADKYGQIAITFIDSDN